MDNAIETLESAAKGTYLRKLLFKGKLEKEYREYLMDSQHRPFLMIASVAIVIWFGFLILDIWRITSADLWRHMDFIVFLWIASRTFSFAFIFWFCWYIPKKKGMVVVALAWTVYILLGASVNIGMYAASAKGLFVIDSACVLVIMAAYLPIGLTFRQSTSIALLLTAFSLFTLWICPPGPESHSKIAIIVLISLPFFMISGYLREKADRKQFMYALLLKKQSETDQLTNIPNRRHFLEHVSVLLERARTRDETLSVGIMDIDFFKKFNDTYGHLQGDVALRAVADALRQSVQEADSLLARFGGEEFIVAFYNRDAQYIWSRFEQIRARIEQLPVSHVQSPFGHLTLSIGYAMLCPQDSQIEDLIKRADDALYLAKEQGRNQTVAQTDC
ncbi:diguanylate cyclase [Saccharibacillus sacchari]|uniref:Diguanylate cyclase n=1 Tax=Saccharibacillus sacchari TaxID=456493 RepID=A0ACC6P8U9_9BACL